LAVLKALSHGVPGLEVVRLALLGTASVITVAFADNRRSVQALYDKLTREREAYRQSFISRGLPVPPMNRVVIDDHLVVP